MRAMLSVLLRTAAWVIWIPVVGYFLLNVLSGEGDLATLFAILFGGCLAVAPLFHYGIKLKYPAIPSERRQTRTAPPSGTTGPQQLPDAPQGPQGREIATPPFARKTSNASQQVQGAMSPMLRQFITDGAADIDGKDKQ